MSNDLLIQKESATFTQAVRNILRSTCIVDFGVILKVVAKGVVKVGISVAKENNDISIVTCTLLSTVSQSLSIDIEPQEGDKVLVFYPSRFKNKMFSLAQKEVIVDEDAVSYGALGAVAILFNQYRANDYEKSIQINKDGELSLSVNDVVISTDKDNAVSVSNGKATVGIDKEGAVSVDNGKATVTIDKDGNVEVNAKGGKISLKNNSQSLFDILDGLIDKLNGGTVTTSGSPAKQLIDPSQFTTYKENLGGLMQ